jgi:tetratricopeptide (TPR) repeat protein
MNGGLMIITLLEHSDDEDVRYLLSLSLDPFDAAADMYERIGNWESAIAIRKNALRLFPFKSGLHKKGLGRNHYFLARSFEEKEQKKKAVENYKIAVTYLLPSSEYFEKAMDGLGRLEEK